MNRATKWIGALGGLVLTGAAVIPATAAGTITITPGATEITTLNYGAQIESPNAIVGALNGTIAPRLANATYGVEVTDDVYKLRLVFDSYTPPAGVTINLPTAFLWYRQDGNTDVNVPTTGWDALVATGATATADDTDDPNRHTLCRATGSRRCDDPIYLTARFPGTYRFHFVDPGRAGGTDDDSVSPTITMTVKDVQLPGTFGATDTALTDDWQPKLTAPAVVGVTKGLTTKVDLTELTLVDSRGSNGGVGVLNDRIADLVGVKFASPFGAAGDALDNDLRLAGTTPFRDYSCFGTPGCTEWVDLSATVWANLGGFWWPTNVAGAVLHPAAAAGAVNASGERSVPAVTQGVDTLRHAGTVRSIAVLDRTGAGLVDWTYQGQGTSLIYRDASPSVIDTQVAVNVPNAVTLSVSPASCVGACTVTLSGTADGASQVTIGGYGSGITANVDPVTKAFTATQKITRTATFQASTGTGSSDNAKVTVKSTVVSWSAKAGKGKVTVKVSGGPRGGGVCYVKVSGKSTVTKQASGPAGSAGTGTCTVTVTGVKKGNRTVKVGYDSPRASISGWTSTKSVKVS